MNADVHGLLPSCPPVHAFLQQVCAGAAACLAFLAFSRLLQR